jgi:hypothetical protein
MQCINDILLDLIIHSYLMIPYEFQGLIKVTLYVTMSRNIETVELGKEAIK